MPSFASYLDMLNSPDRTISRMASGYTSYLEYAAAELQREMDAQFLEGPQWKKTQYQAPEGFQTVELNSNFMLVEGTIHRLR